jgi:hypothetical protein
MRIHRFVALALALVPGLVAGAGVAAAQGTDPNAGGGGAAPGGQPPQGAPAGSASAAKPPGEIGGYAYSDKPAPRSAAPAPAHVYRHVGGPIATLPGFEETSDGGSRLFVQLSQQVPIEQRASAGTLTYVLKGAHVNRWNNTNALVTVHFNTPVTRARLVPQGNDLLFIVDLRAAVTPTFKMTEAQDHTATLDIVFAKGDYLNGTQAAPADTPATTTAPRPNAAAGSHRIKPKNAIPAATPAPTTTPNQ